MREIERILQARPRDLGGFHVDRVLPLDGPRYMWWNFVSSSKDRIIEAAQTWRAGGFPVVPGDEIERTPAPDGPRFATETE